MLWATVCSNKITEKLEASPSKDQSILIRCSRGFSDRYMRIYVRGDWKVQMKCNQSIIEQEDCHKWNWMLLKAQLSDIQICPRPTLCFFRRFLWSITIIFISPGIYLCKKVCQINERRQTTCSACRAQVPLKRLLRMSHGVFPGVLLPGNREGTPGPGWHFGVIPGAVELELSQVHLLVTYILHL